MITHLPFKNKRGFVPTIIGTNFFLCAVISILICSCTNESSMIGLNVLPKKDLLDAKYNDTTSIVSYTVKSDSVRTDHAIQFEFNNQGHYNNFLGSYNDPVFGKTTTSIYTQLSLPNNITNLYLGNPDSLLLDSVVLSLAYRGEYYGNLDVQTIKIYRLNDALSLDSSYYSNRNLNYSSEESANISFIPNPFDSVSVAGVKRGPHLRIKLDKQLGNDILGHGNFADNTAFIDFFKGLYITPGNAVQESGKGSILYLKIPDPLSALTLYYKKKSTPDTSYQYSFDINNTSARFNHYEHVFSSTINEQLNDHSLGQNLIFVQSTAGLKAKIIFPFLKNWVKPGPVSVNKAEIILKVDPSFATSPYFPPPELFIVGIDSLGRNTSIPDFSEGFSYYGGSYDPINKSYTFNVARYVQSVLDGKRKDYGLAIISSENNLYGLMNDANRVVLGGGKNGLYKMSLHLTYTKLY